MQAVGVAKLVDKKQLTQDTGVDLSGNGEYQVAVVKQDFVGFGQHLVTPALGAHQVEQFGILQLFQILVQPETGNLASFGQLGQIGTSGTLVARR